LNLKNLPLNGHLRLTINPGKWKIAAPDRNGWEGYKKRFKVM